VSDEGKAEDNEGRCREEGEEEKNGSIAGTRMRFSLSRECSAIGIEQLHERGTNETISPGVFYTDELWARGRTPPNGARVVIS
jgi:hypothetical protein